jgi:hypothetical protein
MAIVSVKQQFRGRGGRHRIRGREYNEYYIVETSGIDIGTFYVLTAVDPDDGTRVPLPGDQHPDDQFAYVEFTEPVQVDESERVHTVHVKYSTIVPDVPEAVAPLDRTPRFSWGFLSTTVPYAIDANGDPSINTAGVPYDPLPARTQSIPVLNVRWNSDSYSQSLVTSRMDTINSDAFSVVGYQIPIGQAKLVAWNAEWFSEAGQNFFTNSVTLQFRQANPGWIAYDPALSVAEPWDQVILQFGFTQLNAEGKLEAILVKEIPEPGHTGTVERVQPQEAQKLDVNGRWIGADDYDGPGTDAAWRIHRPYESATFSALGLPP